MDFMNFFDAFFEILKKQGIDIFNDPAFYEDTGTYGETLTESALNSDSINGYKIIFRNLLIPYRDRTTEIDLLMVHEKGIFVFESKNYSGWIFGKFNQLKWTQSLPHGEKYQFYNPIMQNQTHIKALSEVLQLPVSYFFSYIVFSERCELKSVPDNTEQVSIVRRPKMIQRLCQQLDTLPELYTLPVMESIATIIRKFANKSKAEYQAHADNVQKRMNSDICPLCKSKLVLRQGKYGMFLGCSSYPQCHYTRNL